MSPIKKDNFDNKCMEESCIEKYTYAEKLEINNMVVFVLLCDKHAEQWNKNLFEEIEKIKWQSIM